MKKKKTTAKNSITINGQLIPWSFVWRVHAKCGRNWDATIDCFWKAKHCDGENGIQRYIMSGLRGETYGDQWMRHPSRAREDGRMGSLREWWLGLYERKGRPGEAEESVDVSGMIAELSGKFGMGEAIGWGAAAGAVRL